LLLACAPAGEHRGRQHAGHHRAEDVEIVPLDGGDDGLLAGIVVDADQP
jgi:hypothetical protein